MRASLLLLSSVALLSCCGALASRSHRHRYHREDAEDRRLGSSQDAPFLTFDQREDHFDPARRTTWAQRYLINDTFWGGNGFPIILDLGGERETSPMTLQGKYEINAMAASMRALLLSVEHRFYGRSVPGDGSLSVANLRLLSAEQALADYALFAQTMRERLGAKDSKIVSVGGSYSGMLSAWLRQKYPHVIHAALASSAPVLAELEFTEYLDVVSASLGSQCAALVQKGFDWVDALLSQGSAGKATLQKAFSTCTPIGGSVLDEATFIDAIGGPIADTVQYNLDNNKRGLAWTIDRMCTALSSAPIEQSFPKYVLDWMSANSGNCTEANYLEQVAELKNEDARSDVASGRSWTWQTCTAFGFYQTGHPPFSRRNNLDYYLGLCKDVYGISPSSLPGAVAQTNAYYGARNIGGTRIVLVNGSVDPWHALGVLRSTNPLLPAIYITGTAHCADDYAAGPGDSQGLIDAKAKSLNLIRQWLSQD